MKMRLRLRTVGVLALCGAALALVFGAGVYTGRHLRVDDPTTVERFHRLFYEAPTWSNSRWLGVPIEKCPMDLMAYQEILFDTRPDVLVEAGTFKGGSALYFASIMDLLGRGRVITIDTVNAGRPAHPRIAYLQGASTAPEIVAAVKAQIRAGETVMVVLDSDHSFENVLKELRTYSPLVTRGAYLVVEDTNINGHPVYPDFGPGPSEALDEFFKAEHGFVRDRSREKYLLTMHPGGFLRKVRG